MHGESRSSGRERRSGSSYASVDRTSGRRRRAALRAVTGLAEERRAVLEHGVDLPALAVRRALHPELVLLRVATGRSALVDGGQAGVGKPGLLGVDDVGRLDLDAEVVEAAALTGVL